jgi:hypothetical protein
MKNYKRASADVKAEFMELLASHAPHQRAALKTALKAGDVTAAPYFSGGCGCVYGVINEMDAYAALKDPVRLKWRERVPPYDDVPFVSFVELFLFHNLSRTRCVRPGTMKITKKAANVLLRWMKEYEIQTASL